MTDYITTCAECQHQIESGGRVCSRCGGPLKPIETEDNAHQPTFWTGCIHCGYFDDGVAREAFEIARGLVQKHHFTLYRDAPENANISAMAHCVEAMWRLQAERLGVGAPKHGDARICAGSEAEQERERRPQPKRLKQLKPDDET